MDIKSKVEEIVAKVQKDPNFMKQFQSDPVKAVEGIVGVDLPDDMINQVVAGVKAKIAGDKVGGAVDALKKLF